MLGRDRRSSRERSDRARHARAARPRPGRQRHALDGRRQQRRCGIAERYVVHGEVLAREQDAKPDLRGWLGALGGKLLAARPRYGEHEVEAVEQRAREAFGVALDPLRCADAGRSRVTP